LHPKGIPHGPAPGAWSEASRIIETLELAKLWSIIFCPFNGVTEEAMELTTDNIIKSCSRINQNKHNELQ
jgi:hypothetical protein